MTNQETSVQQRTSEDDDSPYVGRSRPSYKAEALVSGRARYTGDHSFPGQLHASIVRSPHASATIKSVHVQDAAKMHGVVLALDGREAAKHVEAVPHYCDPAVVGGHSIPVHCLAIDDVHYVGHAVAVVVAIDRQTAMEAARRVKVEYQTRTPAVQTADAIAADAPLVVPAWGTNVQIALPFKDGDCDSAFAAAHAVVASRLKIHRYSTQPIETRTYNATWDAEEQMLTLYATVQSPHALRHFLARALRMPENRVRVVAPWPGGSFGLKMHGHPEELLTCLLARLTRRPVKWVESREECLLIGSREQEHEVQMALSQDGRILGLRDRFVANVGAPSATAGLWMAYLTGLTMPGPYDVADIDVQMKIVTSNKAPWNAARAYGKEATAIVLEFMMDKAARRLGLDPAEIRYRNFIRPEAFPKKTPTGLILDSGDYEGATRKALEVFGYEALRKEQALSRRLGRLVGIGIGYELVPEGGALPGTFFSGFDTTTVKVDPGGFVTVSTGVTDPGTGNAIGIAQIVADELGVNVENVRVIQGDTDKCPYGVGNYAARSIIFGGGAAAMAARELRAKVLKVAAAMLSVDEGSLSLHRGVIKSTAKPEASLSLGEVSFVAHTHPNDIAGCIQPPLEASATCKPDWIRHTPDEKGRMNAYTSYANGAYVALVEIDRDTGVLQVLKLACAHDCGKAINPSMVEGQVAGAMVMGLGGMLSEEQVYETNGHQTTRDFTDYVMPRALDVPEIAMAHHDVPHPVTLYGVKGAGESGLGGTAAALINAVNDALAPIGAEITEFPLSAQNIWHAIQRATASAQQPRTEVSA